MEENVGIGLSLRARMNLIFSSVFTSLHFHLSARVSHDCLTLKYIWYYTTIGKWKATKWRVLETKKNRKTRNTTEKTTDPQTTKEI